MWLDEGLRGASSGPTNLIQVCRSFSDVGMVLLMFWWAFKKSIIAFQEGLKMQRE